MGRENGPLGGFVVKQRMGRHGDCLAKFACYHKDVAVLLPFWRC